MPFQSDKQRKYLYSEHPEIAEKFAQHNKEEDKKKPLKKRVKDTWHGDKWKEEKKVDKK